jgi:cysteine desulfurase
MCIKGIDSESLLLMLDIKNICASSGSACNSSCLESSHVLKAIQVPKEIINNSLRITLGEENQVSEVRYIAKILCDIVKNN